MYHVPKNNFTDGQNTREQNRGKLIETLEWLSHAFIYTLTQRSLVGYDLAQMSLNSMNTTFSRKINRKQLKVLFNLITVLPHSTVPQVWLATEANWEQLGEMFTSFTARHPATCT